MTPTLPVAPQPAVGGGHPLEGIANTTSPNVITYYLNEQSATAGGSRPCIVMLLDYQGREFYYRMDYTWDGIKGSGAPPYEKGKYMPILRNHRYIFTIKEVKGPGFDTMQEAITSPENFTNRNIVVTPIVIDEEFADIAFNESGAFSGCNPRRDDAVWQTRRCKYRESVFRTDQLPWRMEYRGL